jgi:protein-S-isoprenylcysteine O-methyltransferase Ste14
MTPAVRKRFTQIGILFMLQAAALFTAAGKMAWWNAWAYLGLYLVFLFANAFILLRKHKDLVEERARAGAGVKTWDKIISGIIFLGGFAVLIVSGLDERFNWIGYIPLQRELSAFGLMTASYPLFTWAMVSNRYFSTLVRIQVERGHSVESGGPYRYVRHPGYTSLLMTYVTIPIALGSQWATIPMILLVVTLIIRTALEDHTLKKELDGYTEYAGRVRFRLVPGIW